MVANNTLTTAQLAKKLGSSHKLVQDILSRSGVEVKKGRVSEDALAALSKTTWVLSEDSGLGAVKAELDKHQVLIREHIFSRAQYFTIEGPTGRKKFIQLYFRGAQSSRTACQFELRGFLRDGAPSHYLIACFQENTFWAVSRKELEQRFEVLQGKSPFHTDEAGWTIPYGFSEHPHGILGISLNVNESPYLLKSSKQLGV